MENKLKYGKLFDLISLYPDYIKIYFKNERGYLNIKNEQLNINNSKTPFYIIKSNLGPDVYSIRTIQCIQDTNECKTYTLYINNNEVDITLNPQNTRFYVFELGRENNSGMSIIGYDLKNGWKPIGINDKSKLILGLNNFWSIELEINIEQLKKNIDPSELNIFLNLLETEKNIIYNYPNIYPTTNNILLIILAIIALLAIISIFIYLYYKNYTNKNLNSNTYNINTTQFIKPINLIK
jgi:hypothetical protein